MKKALTIALAVLLLTAAVPSSAFAEREQDVQVEYSEFSTDQKVAYLNNSASLNAFNTCWGYWSGFDSTEVRQFIQNLASSKEREIFSGYLDIYNGNAQKRYSMCESLENLKKDVADRNTIHFGSTSIGKLYEIKPLAITHYFSTITTTFCTKALEI